MLNDHQETIVSNAARPLHPKLRAAFESAVLGRLREVREIGDGTVSRICRELQREYFDVPRAT